MDPAIANQDFDPPRQRVVGPGLIPAVLAHLLLGVALAWGVNWKFGDSLPSLGLPLPFYRSVSSPPPPPRTAVADANDTARMGAGRVTAPAAADDTRRMGAGPVAASPDADDTRRMGGPPSASALPVSAFPSAAAGSTPPEPRTQVASLTPRPQVHPQAAPREADPAEARMQPSFNCSKAHSANERLICRDPQLSRLDRELGRIHAQAKRAAADPREFKRENDEEWRLREAVCRDKDCLLEWYAHRREQLQERLAKR